MNPSQSITKQTLENCDRFKEIRIVENYPADYRPDVARDRRELAALRRCLRKIPREGDVLDFPCGAGRLLRVLSEEGFHVTGADASAEMIKKVENLSSLSTHQYRNLHQRDVFSSGFADGEFDAVVSNRLFHHFNEGRDRVLAMIELSRIAKGPLVLSFFNSRSLSLQFKILKRRLSGRIFRDRLPVSLRQIKKEAEEAGLTVDYATGVLPWLSPMWYVVLTRP